VHLWHELSLRGSSRPYGFFIAAASGLAPAAIAAIGQAIGTGSISSAKKNAGAVLRLGILAALLFTIFLIAGSFFLPILHPRVGKDVLQVAFWGILIAACLQPVKVLNNILGMGILPSGGDTRFRTPAWYQKSIEGSSTAQK
jgi:Na+-driven multidrug efflux pump